MPFVGARAHLVPALHEGHTLKATWQLPPVQALYRKKAEDYWAHLLGHEGPGSLLSALKARKWATGLFAGAPPPPAATRRAQCQAFESPTQAGVVLAAALALVRAQPSCRAPTAAGTRLTRVRVAAPLPVSLRLHPLWRCRRWRRRGGE